MVIDFNFDVSKLNPGIFKGKQPSDAVLSKYADDYAAWEKTKEGMAPVMPQPGSFTPFEIGVSLLIRLVRESQRLAKTGQLRHTIRLSNDISEQVKEGATSLILTSDDVNYLKNIFGKHDFPTTVHNPNTQKEEPIHEDNIKFILLVEDALKNAKK